MKSLGGMFHRFWFTIALTVCFLASWATCIAVVDASHKRRQQQRKANTCEVQSFTPPSIEKSWGMEDGRSIEINKIIPGVRCHICEDDSTWCEKVYEVQ